MKLMNSYPTRWTVDTADVGISLDELTQQYISTVHSTKHVGSRVYLDNKSESLMELFDWLICKIDRRTKQMIIADWAD